MVPRKILFARYIWAYMCITRENDLSYLHLSTAYLHINFCISIYYISGIYYSKIIIQISKWSSRWKTINLNSRHSLIPLAPYLNGDEIFHNWLYKGFEKKNALEKKDGFKGAMILYRGMTCVTHSVYFLSSDTLVDL